MEFIQILIYHAQKRGKLSVRAVTNYDLGISKNSLFYLTDKV